MGGFNDGQTGARIGGGQTEERTASLSLSLCPSLFVCLSTRQLKTPNNDRRKDRQINRNANRQDDKQTNS